MEKEYKENVKYPKSEVENINKWWQENQQYDVNEYSDYVEIVLRPNWEEEQIARLRKEREKVCFPIINRGALWYNKLTDVQKNELQAWYQAWLDVTVTKVKPATPSWI